VSLERESLEEERFVGQLRRLQLTGRVESGIQHSQRLHLDAVRLGNLPDSCARRQPDELEQRVPLVHTALAVRAEALGGILPPPVAEETEVRAHVRRHEELHSDVSVPAFQRRGGVLAHKSVLPGAVALPSGISSSMTSVCAFVLEIWRASKVTLTIYLPCFERSLLISFGLS
jgi:hypothetical protein